MFGQEKVTKEKAAPVSRAVRVPCAACLTSAAVELGVPRRKRLGTPQTVLAEIPEVNRAARRDIGAPNNAKQKPKGVMSEARCAIMKTRPDVTGRRTV